MNYSFFPSSFLVVSFSCPFPWRLLASPACVIGAGNSRIVVPSGATPLPREGGSDRELRGGLSTCIAEGNFLAALESWFLYLAADVHSVLRGWRPSYRSVLLAVRQKLNIACSSKLSTKDLEAEIFLHPLQDFLRKESSTSILWKSPKISNVAHCMELGFDKQKVQANVASKIGFCKGYIEISGLQEFDIISFVVNFSC
ncbi:hypothetical protein MLD38_028277 [Melastoma candidum]|uniref:Uncharacterized protein n=1 Tax=Melastoma candidum TaxID=119954 RepID=A0ACB9N1E3_9MYRT|nr:hypothetical protein MLD38_028277 [Melastoma candidum]